VRAVLQRVSQAQVSIEDRVVGRIGRGFVVLLGVAEGDSERDASPSGRHQLGARPSFTGAALN